MVVPSKISEALEQVHSLVGRSFLNNSLGCRVIRLQRIYNFLLFHAIILSVLDV